MTAAQSQGVIAAGQTTISNVCWWSEQVTMTSDRTVPGAGNAEPRRGQGFVVPARAAAAVTGVRRFVFAVGRRGRAAGQVR